MPDIEKDENVDDVQEPSTEKEPGEEAKAPKELREQEPEPSHEAVGIGIIGRPQTAPNGPPSPERRSSDG